MCEHEVIHVGQALRISSHKPYPIISNNVQDTKRGLTYTTRPAPSKIPCLTVSPVVMYGDAIQGYCPIITYLGCFIRTFGSIYKYTLLFLHTWMPAINMEPFTNLGMASHSIKYSFLDNKGFKQFHNGFRYL